jgi:DNA invertase Pin-like site-specific DNA recombinase
MSPDTKPTKPVDIYIRVSRTGGRDVQADGGTADEQEKDCRSQLAHDGLVAGEVFVDLDESGGKTSRPQFDVAMQRVRDGVSGGIVARNLRRFGRTTTGVIQGIQEVEAHGGVFISKEEKIDTSTPMGRYFLTILAALGQMELEERTEGFRKARANAVDRGIHVSARVPAGYVRNGERVLVPSQHAPTILRAFELRADGATWQAVAAILTEAGVPKSRETDGAVWTAQAVAQTLENRVYLGEARSGDYVKEGAHEAIVSPGLFARVQARKTERDSFADPARYRDLLAGLVRCSCGASMTRNRKLKGGDYEWRCSARCANATTVPYAKLERLVLNYVRDNADALSVEVPRSNDEAVRAAQIRLDNAVAAVEDFTANADLSKGSSAVLALLARLEADRDAAAEALNVIVSGATGESDWAIDPTEVPDNEIGIFVKVDTSSGKVSGQAIVWHLLNTNQRDNARARRMVRQLIERVVVTKASGTHAALEDRVEVTLV